MVRNKDQNHSGGLGDLLLKFSNHFYFNKKTRRPYQRNCEQSCLKQQRQAGSEVVAPDAPKAAAGPRRAVHEFPITSKIHHFMARSVTWRSQNACGVFPPFGALRLFRFRSDARAGVPTPRRTSFLSTPWLVSRPLRSQVLGVFDRQIPAVPQKRSGRVGPRIHLAR